MKIEILGCPVDNVTMEEAINQISQFVHEKTVHQGVAINADKVIMAHKDHEIMEILRRTDLVYADGMPVIWASYLLGKPLKERVTGIDLFLRLAEHAAKTNWRIYLLGARQEVVEKTVEVLENRFPGIIIAGYRNGYWALEQEEGVAQEIARTKPDLLFVAITSPKKEQFLDAYQAKMGIPYAMGVGGSFDVVSGLVKRAPVWMQKTGMEWFYRFLQEPRRMFYRYFIKDMMFFALLAKAVFLRMIGKSK